MAFKYIRIIIATVLSFSIASTYAQQQQDPSTMNGGSMMAMAGENCVAIAVDKRFGSGPQMINVLPRTVLIPHSSVMIGLVGLEGDVQSLSKELSVQISAKMGRHLGFGNGDINGRQINPKSASTLLSHLLYRRRNGPYYIEPIIAGLEEIILDKSGEDGQNRIGISNVELERKIENASIDHISTIYKPFLCAQDLIGAQSKSTSFVCSGAASKSLYGTAEAMWRPNLQPEELVQVLGKAFLSALERNCLSGYGAVLYLMVAGQGIEEIHLASRND